MSVPLWLVFALLSVAGKTVFYVFQKRLLEDESSLRAGYVTAVYGVCFIVPFAAHNVATDGLSATRAQLLIIVALGVVELVAFVVYLRALQLTDLGIASPIKKSKPVAIALVEPVVLGAAFSPVVAGAAILAGLGGYVVMMDEAELLAPLRRITDPGPALAVAAAGLYVVLSLGSRFGTTAASPYVYGLIVFGVMSVGYGAGLWRADDLPSIREHFRREYVVIGFLGFFRSLTVWIAYSLATATAVSTVTQLTILLDVLAGGALLGESGVKRRLVGAALILVGALVVILLPTPR